MKTIRYTIPDTYLILRDNTPLASPFFIVRDKPAKKTKLEKLFANSYKIFRVRVRDLGNVNMPTTEQDIGALQVMLDGLIRAKKQIRTERGEWNA